MVYAFKIEHATNGGVPAAAWLSTEKGQLAWNKRPVNWNKVNAKERVSIRRRIKNLRKKHGPYYGTPKRGKPVGKWGGKRTPCNQFAKRREQHAPQEE